MAQKRLFSEAYDEPVSASKAAKFSTPPSAKSKFDSPRLFDPRYQASEDLHQEHGDDDDVEVDPDFTDDEDEDNEKPGEGKDADKTYQYTAEDEDDSSDEDNDDETDEPYSEDDGTAHDSGYSSTPARDEEAESSVDAPQETFPFANVLQLKNMRTHNIAYWLTRRRYDANFPRALILLHCSLTHEQLQQVLDLVQPGCLTLSQYTPADGFWGTTFRILGEQELKFLKVKCKSEEMGWRVVRRGGKPVERQWPGDGLFVTMRGYESVEIGTEDLQRQFEELAGRSATMY